MVAFGEALYSGGIPQGEVAFDTLQAWGVRTIISVDGARPDLEKAKARGIRYIHLPIGYNGFDEERKLQLVRAVRDLPKPIYLHCHHGKHRSAGAAGTVAVSLGWLDVPRAIDRMKVSGTSKDYKGLYRVTERAVRLPDEVIDTVPADFPEYSRPSGMVEAMVLMDDAFSHLQLIEKADWKTPERHPDLVPAAEAGRLADLFRLLLDDAQVKERPEDFHRMLRESRELSSRIEEGLAGAASDPAALSAALKALNASCKECHVKFRD